MTPFLQWKVLGIPWALGVKLHHRACQLHLYFLQVPLRVQALPIAPLTFLPMITAMRWQCCLQHTSCALGHCRYYHRTQCMQVTLIHRQEDVVIAREIGRWSDSTLESAKNVVDIGGQIRTVAKLYGIPTSSLADHVNGRTLTRKRGRESVLSAAEEAQLVDYVLKMVELGHPISLGQLKVKVAELVQFRPTPFIA
jgi:hypothetical protein